MIKKVFALLVFAWFHVSQLSAANVYVHHEEKSSGKNLFGLEQMVGVYHQGNQYLFARRKLSHEDNDSFLMYVTSQKGTGRLSGYKKVLSENDFPNGLGKMFAACDFKGEIHFFALNRRQNKDKIHHFSIKNKFITSLGTIETELGISNLTSTNSFFMKAQVFNGKIYLFFTPDSGNVKYISSYNGVNWTTPKNLHGDIKGWNFDSDVYLDNSTEGLKKPILVFAEVNPDHNRKINVHKFNTNLEKISSTETSTYSHSFISTRIAVGTVREQQNKTLSLQIWGVYKNPGKLIDKWGLRHNTYCLAQNKDSGWRGVKDNIWLDATERYGSIQNCFSVTPGFHKTLNSASQEYDLEKYLTIFMGIRGQGVYTSYYFHYYNYFSDKLTALSADHDIVFDTAQTPNAWSLIGVIHGVPPFAKNETVEAECSELSIDFTNSTSNCIKTSYKDSFEFGIQLGIPGEKEKEGKSKKSGKASIGYSYESAIETNLLNEVTETETLNFSWVNGGHNDKGFLIFAKPVFNIKKYRTFSADNSDLNLNCIIQEINRVNIEYDEYKIDNPLASTYCNSSLTRGMASRPISSKYEDWNQSQFNKEKDTIHYSVKHFNSLTGTVGGTSKMSYDRTNISSISTNSSKSHTFTFKIEAEIMNFIGAGLSVGQNFEHSFEVEVKTENSNAIGFSYTLPSQADAGGSVRKITVTPVWLTAKTIHAFWLPEQYKNDRPWCISYYVNTIEYTNPQHTSATILDTGNNTTLMLEDGCHIINKEDFKSNKAIIVTNSSVTFKDITFNNRITSNNSNLTFDNCTFTVNSSGMNGGAIYIDQGSVELNNCSFLNCQANQGAALYINNGWVSLCNTSFTDNMSTLNQGADIYINNGVVKIDDATFNQTGRTNFSSIFITKDSLLQMCNTQFNHHLSHVENNGTLSLYFCTLNNVSIIGTETGILHTTNSIIHKIGTNQTVNSLTGSCIASLSDTATINAFYGSFLNTDPGLQTENLNDILTVTGLSAESPCIDSGESLSGMVGIDRHNNLRDKTPDIGTFEVNPTLDKTTLLKQKITLSRGKEGATRDGLYVSFEFKMPTDFELKPFDENYVIKLGCLIIDSQSMTVGRKATKHLTTYNEITASGKKAGKLMLRYHPAKSVLRIQYKLKNSNLDGFISYLNSHAICDKNSKKRRIDLTNKLVPEVLIGDYQFNGK